MSYFKDIRHPECNRFIHIDVAFSSNTIDRYGIAAGYCTLVDTTIYKDLQKSDINLIEYFSKAEKMYYIDWALGIEPCPHQEIPLSKVRDFIFYLMKNLNYPVASISADTFQSKQTLQDFEQEGYKTDSISVDRTRDPYLFLKQLIYNKQIIMPKHDDLKKEILQLRDNGKKIDHPIGGCFTGDTKIRLVDGRDVSIEDLLIEQQYRSNYVYTFNEQSKVIEPKPIKKVFQTKLTKKLVKVTLDNGEVITCTPEHLFMLRDGSYEQIQNLRPGTSLMPLYTKISEKGLKGYRLYYEPMEDKWHYEHRKFSNPDKIKKVVHHCNYNKLDNTPTNLKPVTGSEHRTIHNNYTLDYENVSKKVSAYHSRVKGTKEYEERNNKISAKVTAYNMAHRKTKNALHKKQKTERIQEIEKYFNIDFDKLTKNEKNSYAVKWSRIKDPTLISKSAVSTSNAHKQGKFKNALKAISERIWVTNGTENLYIKKYEPIPNGFYRGRVLKQITKQHMKEAHQKRSPEEKLKLSQRISEITSNRIWITNGIEDRYIDKNSDIPEGFSRGRSKVGKNHKIISIEFINKPCRVYDLEIVDNHNFALSAGVIVHNSKDISDSVAGCIWNCANSKNIVNVGKITQAVLNPYASTNQIRSYTEQELKSLEMMEFERMKSQFSSGIFRGM